MPIRYGSDMKLARQIIYDAAYAVTDDYAVQARDAWKKVVRRYLIEDSTVEAMVTMVADENWVTFTVRYSYIQNFLEECRCKAQGAQRKDFTET